MNKNLCDNFQRMLTNLMCPLSFAGKRKKDGLYMIFITTYECNHVTCSGLETALKTYTILKRLP